jgi:hypothetical protein
LRAAKVVKNAVTITNRKFAGCVELNEKFHYETGYGTQHGVNYCRVEQGGFNDGRRLDL